MIDPFRAVCFGPPHRDRSMLRVTFLRAADSDDLPGGMETRGQRGASPVPSTRLDSG